MRYGVAVALLAVLVVVVLLAMRAGWRGRAARSATLVPVLPGLPAADALGAPLLGPVEATYVSTTVAGDWLDRVVAHDLGARSAAVVSVHEAGVLVARTGARDLFVPAAALREVTLAPGMAGKVVGGDGLVVLRWAAAAARGARLRDDDAAPTLLDSGLRTRRGADREALTTAVRTLLASAPEHTPAAPADEPVAPEQPPKEQHA